MTVTLFYNQYANGGAIDREGWEAFDADNEVMTYGSCYSLRTAEVDLPDGWQIADVCGKPAIVDETGYAVTIDNEKSDVDTIYVYDGKTPYARRLK